MNHDEYWDINQPSLEHTTNLRINFSFHPENGMISHRSVSYRCYSLLAPDPPALQRYFLRASSNSFHISEHRQLLRFKTFSSRKTVLHKCSENMLNLKNQFIRGFKTALVSTRKSPPTLTVMALRKGIVSVAGQEVKVSRGRYRVWGSRLESVGGWWWKKNQHTALDFNILP